MINEYDFRSLNYNILGAQSSFKGDIYLKGDSILSSHFEGTIEVKESGKLTLERGSNVKGTIKAIDLEIFGEFIGDIDCTGIVSIRSNAKVSGTIKSAKLVIYPGAIVDMTANSETDT